MTLHTAAEVDLIRSSQQGDARAFGELVRRYYRLVVSIAYRLCNDPQMAEDMAQEAFLKAWQALPRFRIREEGESTGFRAWVSRIVVNATIDEMRRQRPATGLDDLTPAGGIRPAEALDRVVEAEMVRSAIARLPERSRAALILREYEGLSYEEIAEALDIPIGTVMSRLNYARKRLREELSHYFP
ncbi:MAG: sigma-70 family RNA polymerase sigma factor [Anaerolineae bacterium]|nr:sigma-70 family RNA polymerase sigma factor [Anaerolineae bacterium]